jgi:hypothetical protein
MAAVALVALYVLIVFLQMPSLDSILNSKLPSRSVMVPYLSTEESAALYIATLAKGTGRFSLSLIIPLTDTCANPVLIVRRIARSVAERVLKQFIFCEFF